MEQNLSWVEAASILDIMKTNASERHQEVIKMPMTRINETLKAFIYNEFVH